MPRLLKADKVRLVKRLQAIRRDAAALAKEVAGYTPRYSKASAACTQAATFAAAAINLILDPADVAGGIRDAVENKTPRRPN